MLWDLLHFYSSLWASCTITFRAVPLNVIQLGWLYVCNMKGWITLRGVEFSLEEFCVCL